MSNDLVALRERPIPSSADAIALKEGYRRDVPIDHRGQAAVEPCVELRDLGLLGANHYSHAMNPPYRVAVPGAVPNLLLREDAAQRLVAVDRLLAAEGMRLFVFDAWRPQAVQRYFHDVWFPAWLSARRPELSGDALMIEVQQYWAAPTTSADSPSPHSTGGAVDLTIVAAETLQPLFMGGIFDDVTEDAWTDAWERRPAVSMSDDEARANRRLLYWAMAEAGFANNPTEWWHYSWGDQMWARLTGQKTARYGACAPLGPETP